MKSFDAVQFLVAKTTNTSFKLHFRFLVDLEKLIKYKDEAQR